MIESERPPLSYPPDNLDYSADYDTPRSYARIGRALILFIFNAQLDRNDPRLTWLVEGVNNINGARLIDCDGFTHDPTAHRSHWMNPRGSWGGHNGRGGLDPDEALTDDKEREIRETLAAEWRCGWCGALEGFEEAKRPCPDGSGEPAS